MRDGPGQGQGQAVEGCLGLPLEDSISQSGASKPFQGAHEVKVLSQ